MLDRAAVPNVRSGIIVELADRQWIVDEATSGVDGLLLVLSVTMFYAFSARRSTLTIVMLLAAALFWAVAASVARVAGIAYLAAQQGQNLSRAWPNAVLGLVAVATTLALVWSTDRLLWILAALVRHFRFWNQIADSGPKQRRSRRSRNMHCLQSRGLVSWRFTAAFGLLAMIQLPLILCRGQHPGLTPGASSMR